MSTINADVVIIGGGVVGCAAAYYLAKTGADVVVLEARGIAAEGSGRSMGFVRTTARHSAELPLALASVDVFPSLSDELSFDVEYIQSGLLLFVYTEDMVTLLKSVVQNQENSGYFGAKVISPKEAFEIVPDLPPDIAGALYCANDGHVNPMKMTYGYYLAAKNLGVKFMTQTPVTDIDVYKGRVTAVRANGIMVNTNWAVNAAGVHAREISQRKGIDLPIAPLYCEIIVTEPLNPFLKPIIGGYDRSGNNIGFRQTAHGNVLFVSTVPNDLTYDISMDKVKLDERMRLMHSVFPEKLGQVSILRTFAGLYDITPDLVPIIDTFESIQGYFAATGFSGHGLTIAPCVGRQVAEWIAEGKPSMNMEAFRYSRFTADEVQAWGTEKRKYHFM